MAMKGDLEKLFREADVDGNNYLTLQELCAAMRRLGYTGDDSVIKAYFAKADASGDNKVTFDEYMKSMSSIPPQMHRSELLSFTSYCCTFGQIAALMRRLFGKFDKDGSGALDRKELQQATKMLGDHFSDEDTGILMEILDKDHSDTVDLEEFIQAYMSKRR